ncbi:ComEC/Rec2 family competence protein [Leifsonia sp. A12D58]|uniref:ComEC/Rec2 family competence protein n=1 Tax=Leifsonia sp. A12D58 TaxID=3397674 RepID=UPI0039E0FB2F
MIGPNGRSSSPSRRATVDARLAVPAAACWATAGVLIGLPGTARYALVVLWAAAIVVITVVVATVPVVPPSRRRMLIRRAMPLACVSLAAAALVASAIAVAEPRRMPASISSAVSTHERVDVLVTLWSQATERRAGGGMFASGTGTPLRARGTITALVDEPDSSGARGAETISVPAVIFFEADASGTRYEIGTSLALTGTMVAADAGDAAAVLFFGSGVAEERAPPSWWLAWANTLRTGFAVAATDLPGDGAALLPGLSIGDTSAVTDDLDTAMKQSSLSHLTAVSGANCALVIAIVMVCGGYLRLRRGVRIALSLIVLLGFVVLVTPEASVLRAAVMASIVMFSLGAGRPGRGVPALLLAVIVLLTIDPWLAGNYGFALSVLATGGLLVLAAPLAKVMARWMPAGIAALLALPLAAQLACQPVLILLSPTIALYGVPANLLAAPAAPMATILGLFACILLPVLPGVADAVMQIAWVPSVWIAATARYTAGLPGSRLPWWDGLLGLTALVLLTAVVLMLMLRRIPGPEHRIETAARAIGLAAVLAVVGAYAGAAIGGVIGRTASFPANWQIAACDIGQGDAVVVRDGDSIALIDVGPDPVPLADCLDELDVNHIDLLVLTHYDQDHVGGLDAVLGIVTLALVGAPTSAKDEHVQARLSAGGAELRRAASGDGGLLGELVWRVLWPRGTGPPTAGNDGSVVVTFEGRGIRSIFLGDLGEDSQQAVWAAAKPASVDVVKVAHHGSGDQSAELYRKLQATVGLISVGADNGYGHPTAGLLRMLTDAHTTALRTDLRGLLVIAPSPAGGGALTVWTERR